MFLSSNVSRFEDDGSLVVDLRENGGPLVRYGPFDKGMPWFRWSQDQWLETAFDWGTQIVSSAHRTRRDLPVLRYLHDWPHDLISTLCSISYAQSTIMQVCALYPAARDLARTNLILLWLVAERYSEDAAWRARFPGVLEFRQRELLAAVLDQPNVRPAQIRFLRKLVLMSGDSGTLHWIRSVVANKNLVMMFCHWPRLLSSLLPLLSGPMLRHIHWLRDRLASTNNSWVLRQIVDDRVGMLLDTSRMLAQMEENIGHDVSCELIARVSPNWEGMQRLHDVLLDQWLHRDDGNSTNEMLLDPAITFGTPPIPSDEQFQAITTVGQLQEEGESMQHCVLTRAPDVIAGDCYIYRVEVCGERGTLQVGITDKGLVIDDFLLKKNAEPSPGAWTAARVWLEHNLPKM